MFFDGKSAIALAGCRNLIPINVCGVTKLLGKGFTSMHKSKCNYYSLRLGFILALETICKTITALMRRKLE
jgi:hypothetical protein